MNATANITSPVSPFHQRQNSYFSDRQLVASPAGEAAQQTPNQAGLGLYPLTIPQSSHRSTLRSATPPQNSAWSHSSAEQQAFSAPVSSQQEMYTASPFDNFSNFTPQPQHQTQHQHQHQHQHQQSLSSPEAPALEYCQSATSSELPSHRSSVCSYTSEASEMAMTAARSKAEEPGWYPAPANEHIIHRSMTSPGQMHFGPGHNMMPSNTEDLYRHNGQNGDWAATDSKFDMQPASNGRLPTFDMAPVLPSVTRVNKKKRQRTRPEEATHECRVCGKLFKRSYNWKSHMETHNPDRKYPHPCTAMVGSQQCSKKFQRKTDLDRHFESVHLKARNHKCTLCGNRFARRDTLRRHTEDGCPKRFELGLRDAAAAQMQQQQQQQTHHQPQPMAQHVHQPQPQTHQPPRNPWYTSQVSMAPPMMPSHLTATGSAFPAYAMPPPAVPYTA